MTTTKTKKASPTKSTAKKSTKVAKRALVCATGEQCFWTTDGRIISNLVELSEQLAHMSDEVFAYHAHAARNDFADWIDAVLGDSELAKSMRASRKPKTAHTIVVRRLKLYDI